MAQKDETKKELIEEINLLKKRITELEKLDSERKKVEAKIEEQRNFLEKILESLVYPFYVIDVKDYTVKMANSAAGFGDLSKGLTCYALTHKRDSPCAEEHLCPLEEVVRTKKAVVTEHIHYDQDGNAKYVEVRGNPIFDSEGNVVQVIEYAMDISERKKAEEALRASETKYRLLAENIPQKIFIKDRNSVYISCNANYARDLKIKVEEMKGKTDYDFYPKELAEKYRADDERIIEKGEIEDIEEKYIQNGKEFFVHTVKTPLKDERDNVIGISGIFWDITERKKIEEEDSKHMQELQVFYKASIGREERILELKKEIERLRMESARKQEEKA